MTADLTAALESLVRGETTSARLMQASFDAGNATPDVFVRTFHDEAMASAQGADRLRASGAESPKLGGLALSIKDLFDVAGHPTTAGSVVLQAQQAAVSDSACVSLLKQAGAALVGHTNMTEFAYSGLGLNPHHGTPWNPATLALDIQARIPGGSSSGAAVSVAAGAAWAALGTDTGGSLRIPAALCGLVGYKATQALTPRQGMMPLSETLDTAGAITLSVRDAILLQEVLSARSFNVRQRDARTLRLLAPTSVFRDGMDAQVANAFERVLRILAQAGADIVERDVDGLDTFDTVRTLSGIVAHEAFANHRERLSTQAGRYDPRVALRIRKGESVPAGAYRELLVLRDQWRRRVGLNITSFDAVMVPTVPFVAPRLLPLVDDDELFSDVNLAMLRNPSVVNHLGGCAISIPCHSAGQMPAGLMLFSAGGKDSQLLEAALAAESALSSGLADRTDARRLLPPPA